MRESLKEPIYIKQKKLGLKERDFKEKTGLCVCLKSKRRTVCRNNSLARFIVVKKIV